MISRISCAPILELFAGRKVHYARDGTNADLSLLCQTNNSEKYLAPHQTGRTLEMPTAEVFIWPDANIAKSLAGFFR
jgi:hypothetical protein